MLRSPILRQISFQSLHSRALHDKWHQGSLPAFVKQLRSLHRPDYPTLQVRNWDVDNQDHKARLRFVVVWLRCARNTVDLLGNLPNLRCRVGASARSLAHLTYDQLFS
jgi:hypothetical protein